MSLSKNIDHLVIADGIKSVLVDDGERQYRGDKHWHTVFDSALDLFQFTDEPSIKLNVGKTTIIVQRELLEVVVVALPTGHPTSKSIRRMIRRMSRKDRGSTPSPGDQTMGEGTSSSI